VNAQDAMTKIKVNMPVLDETISIVPIKKISINIPATFCGMDGLILDRNRK
jgi:hypothetical protein